MDQVLRARPRNVQFRHRGSCVPPCYELFKPDVNIPLARKLAETYELKSTDIVVNQQAASTHYVSFRYILTGDPFRYLDVAIGIDQIEVAFFNAANIAELIKEVGQVWKLLMEILKPAIKGNYFEVTIHCDSETSTKTFLNGRVEIDSLTSGLDINKGFSVSTKVDKVHATARIGLEVSELIADGLYVTFGFVSKDIVHNAAAFTDLFNTTLVTYRFLQTLAHIELMEPS
jgi:hypothetical protein